MGATACCSTRATWFGQSCRLRAFANGEEWNLMADQLVGRSVAVRCPHADSAAVLDVGRGSEGQVVKRFSCQRCRRGWWEVDGRVTEMSRAVDLMRAANGGSGSRARAKQQRFV